MNKEKLIDAVIERIKEDLLMEDYTAISELLSNIQSRNLLNFLPEEQWNDF